MRSTIYVWCMVCCVHACFFLVFFVFLFLVFCFVFACHKIPLLGRKFLVSCCCLASVCANVTGYHWLFSVSPSQPASLRLHDAVPKYGNQAIGKRLCCTWQHSRPSFLPSPALFLDSMSGYFWLCPFIIHVLTKDNSISLTSRWYYYLIWVNFAMLVFWLFDTLFVNVRRWYIQSTGWCILCRTSSCVGGDVARNSRSSSNTMHMLDVFTIDVFLIWELIVVRGRSPRRYISMLAFSVVVSCSVWRVVCVWLCVVHFVLLVFFLSRDVWTHRGWTGL